MIQIGVPDKAHSLQTLSLSSQHVAVELTYNSTDFRWRLSLYKDNEKVFSGITVMENQPLFSEYPPSVFAGDIFCLRVEDDGLPVGRDNLGIDKPYGLFYLSPVEVEELQS